MKILLVGGTGVLSSAVTAEALRQGMEVTMINRGQREIPKGVELLKHDCHKYNEIESNLTGRHFDAVIDFLCYTEEQLEASFKLYSRFVSQYVYISSCAVYDTRLSGIKKEDSPKPLPISNYSVDKWNSECRLAKLAKTSCCAYTVIRPAITYGDTRIPYGITPPYGYHWTVIGRALAGKPIIRWNGGVNRCNMMRVEEFAVGCVGILGNPDAYGEAFNICGDEVPTFNDVLNAISKVIHREIVTVDISSEFYAKELPNKSGEILGGRSLDACNSNEKIKSILPSFKQTIFLEKGISQTIRAYQNSRFQMGIDWTFDAETDRIIRKWCKQNDISVSKYRLRFIDYIGSASWRDIAHYFKVRDRETFTMRCATRVIRVAKRFIMLVRRGNS